MYMYTIFNCSITRLYVCLTVISLGAVLNFVKGEYQYEGIIKIESTRKMDGVKLNMLVTLNCEELNITCE